MVSVLIASDKHPVKETDMDWKWTMTKEMRYDFFEKCIRFAKENLGYDFFKNLIVYLELKKVRVEKVSLLSIKNGLFCMFPKH